MLSRSTRPKLLLNSLAAALIALGASAAPAGAFSLNPEAGSPGISDVNALHWIAVVVIVIAIVAVNLAILAAIRRSRERDRPGEVQAPRPAQTTASRRTQVRAGAGLAIVAIALFVVATAFSSSSRQTPESHQVVSGISKGQPLEIRATGQQWIWRFNYPNGAFSYERLVVPVGTTVKLDLVSTDVVHNWNIPSLTGKAEAVPGKTDTVYFRVDSPGSHSGYAATHSGQGYAPMKSEVEAVSPAEYESYVAQLKSDIEAAQDHVESQIENNQIP